MEIQEFPPLMLNFTKNQWIIFQDFLAEQCVSELNIFVLVLRQIYFGSFNIIVPKENKNGLIKVKLTALEVWAIHSVLAQLQDNTFSWLFTQTNLYLTNIKNN